MAPGGGGPPMKGGRGPPGGPPIPGGGPIPIPMPECPMPGGGPMPGGPMPGGGPIPIPGGPAAGHSRGEASREQLSNGCGVWSGNAMGMTGGQHALVGVKSWWAQQEGLHEEGVHSPGQHRGSGSAWG